MITNDTLKNMAVRVVETHLNKSEPLNVAISDEAKQQHLNDNEIKRLIEASNQLTYLKMHSVNSDKTFEFPVASFEGVKELLTATPEIQKQASAKTLPLFLGEMEKEASFERPELAPAEREFVVSRLQYELPRMQEEFMVKKADLQVQAVRALKEDPELLAKIAQLQGTDYRGRPRGRNPQPGTCLLGTDRSGDTDFQRPNRGRRFFDHELDKAKDLLHKKQQLSDQKEELDKASSLVGKIVGGVGSLGMMLGKSLIKSTPEGKALSPIGNAVLMGAGVKPGVAASNNVGQIIGAG